MFGWFRSLLPTPESVQHNRWLRWLGPALMHPRLWHMSRRGLALGVALGVFFGFLVPIAQIPLSAAAAVVLRANLPVAMASTLVTNPATFGPVYYAAWRVGSAVLGDPAEEPPALGSPAGPLTPAQDQASPAVLAVAAPEPAQTSAGAHDAHPKPAPETGWWAGLIGKFTDVGKPLVLGLVIFAFSGGILCYLLVTWGWALRVRLQRRRRQSLPGRAHR